MVVGFATGDLIWFGTGGSLAFAGPVRLVRLYVDPISSRYVRINKQVLYLPIELSWSKADRTTAPYIQIHADSLP